MSATKVFFAATWNAGRYLCELSVPAIESGKPAHCLIEWSPHVPKVPLSSSEQRAYRRGRDAALAELMAKLGGTAAVLEL